MWAVYDYILKEKIFAEIKRWKFLDRDTHTYTHTPWSLFPPHFIYMGVSPVCVSVHCMYAVPVETRRGREIPWNLS